MGAAYPVQGSPIGLSGRWIGSRLATADAGSHAAPPVAAYIREGTPQEHSETVLRLTATIGTIPHRLDFHGADRHNEPHFAEVGELRDEFRPSLTRWSEAFDASVSAQWPVSPARTDPDAYLFGRADRPGIPGRQRRLRRSASRASPPAPTASWLHLNAIGALLDATYLGNNIGDVGNFVGGLMPLRGSCIGW